MHFHISDILSVTGNKFVSLSNDSKKIYDLLNYMTKDHITDDNIVKAVYVCSYWISKQYPSVCKKYGYLFELLDEYEKLTSPVIYEWLNLHVYGTFPESLNIIPLPEKVWQSHNPLLYLKDQIIEHGYLKIVHSMPYNLKNDVIENIEAEPLSMAKTLSKAKEILNKNDAITAKDSAQQIKFVDYIDHIPNTKKSKSDINFKIL